MIMGLNVKHAENIDQASGDADRQNTSEIEDKPCAYLILNHRNR